ncbi:ABC transporter I family member 1 [Plasmodium yoelii yoelii]|uniref:ABC transporter I family member 1 n=1 Tax=Plasmodium yoelii yoelii TaxID=73239 RepID=A0AAE9WVG4_PLAYO|nr:ABC transporter I family member 1 [Plasmodium yoelii yoelii]
MNIFRIYNSEKECEQNFKYAIFLNENDVKGLGKNQEKNNTKLSYQSIEFNNQILNNYKNKIKDNYKHDNNELTIDDLYKNIYSDKEYEKLLKLKIDQHTLNTIKKTKLYKKFIKNIKSIKSESQYKEFVNDKKNILFFFNFVKNDVIETNYSCGLLGIENLKYESKKDDKKRKSKLFFSNLVGKYLNNLSYHKKIDHKKIDHIKQSEDHYSSNFQNITNLPITSKLNSKNYEQRNNFRLYKPNNGNIKNVNNVSIIPENLDFQNDDPISNISYKIRVGDYALLNSNEKIFFNDININLKQNFINFNTVDDLSFNIYFNEWYYNSFFIALEYHFNYFLLKYNMFKNNGNEEFVNYINKINDKNIVHSNEEPNDDTKYVTNFSLENFYSYKMPVKNLKINAFDALEKNIFRIIIFLSLDFIFILIKNDIKIMLNEMYITIEDICLMDLVIYPFISFIILVSILTFIIYIKSKDTINFSFKIIPLTEKTNIYHKNYNTTIIEETKTENKDNHDSIYNLEFDSRDRNIKNKSINKKHKFIKTAYNNNNDDEVIANNKCCLFIKNVNKFYGKKQALKNISLTLRSNRIFVLLGENGSGKSTLINIITKMINKDSGEIYFVKNDFKLRKDTLEKNQHEKNRNKKELEVSFCSQNVILYDNLTFYETIRIFLLYYNKDVNKYLKKKRTLKMLNGLDLSKYLNDKIENLIDEIKKKISIFICFLVKRDIYILDEPFIALDIKTKTKLFKFFDKIKKNNIILICTHDIYEANKFADDIAIIKSGEILFNGGKRYFQNIINYKFILNVRFNYPSYDNNNNNNDDKYDHISTNEKNVILSISKEINKSNENSKPLLTHEDGILFNKKLKNKSKNTIFDIINGDIKNDENSIESIKNSFIKYIKSSREYNKNCYIFFNRNYIYCTYKINELDKLKNVISILNKLKNVLHYELKTIDIYYTYIYIYTYNEKIKLLKTIQDKDVKKLIKMDPLFYIFYYNTQYFNNIKNQLIMESTKKGNKTITDFGYINDMIQGKITENNNTNIKPGFNKEKNVNFVNDDKLNKSSGSQLEKEQHTEHNPYYNQNKDQNKDQNKGQNKSYNAYTENNAKSDANKLNLENSGKYNNSKSYKIIKKIQNFFSVYITPSIFLKLKKDLSEINFYWYKFLVPLLLLSCGLLIIKCVSLFGKVQYIKLDNSTISSSHLKESIINYGIIYKLKINDSDEYIYNIPEIDKYEYKKKMMIGPFKKYFNLYKENKNKNYVKSKSIIYDSPSHIDNSDKADNADNSDKADNADNSDKADNADNSDNPGNADDDIGKDLFDYYNNTIFSLFKKYSLKENINYIYAYIDEDNLYDSISDYLELRSKLNNDLSLGSYVFIINETQTIDENNNVYSNIEMEINLFHNYTSIHAYPYYTNLVFNVLYDFQNIVNNRNSQKEKVINNIEINNNIHEMKENGKNNKNYYEKIDIKRTDIKNEPFRIKYHEYFIRDFYINMILDSFCLAHALNIRSLCLNLKRDLKTIDNDTIINTHFTTDHWNSNKYNQNTNFFQKIFHNNVFDHTSNDTTQTIPDTCSDKNSFFNERWDFIFIFINCSIYFLILFYKLYRLRYFQKKKKIANQKFKSTFEGKYTFLLNNFNLLNKKYKSKKMNKMNDKKMDDKMNEHNATELKTLEDKHNKRSQIFTDFSRNDKEKIYTISKYENPEILDNTNSQKKLEKKNNLLKENLKKRQNDLQLTEVENIDKKSLQNNVKYILKNINIKIKPYNIYTFSSIYNNDLNVLYLFKYFFLNNMNNSYVYENGTENNRGCFISKMFTSKNKKKKIFDIFSEKAQTKSENECKLLLMPNMTIYEHFNLIFKYKKLNLTDIELLYIIYTLMLLVNLKCDVHIKCNQLSGGMKKKVILMINLLINDDIILLYKLNDNIDFCSQIYINIILKNILEMNSMLNYTQNDDIASSMDYSVIDMNQKKTKKNKNGKRDITKEIGNDYISNKTNRSDDDDNNNKKKNGGTNSVIQTRSEQNLECSISSNVNSINHNIINSFIKENILKLQFSATNYIVYTHIYTDMLYYDYLYLFNKNQIAYKNNVKSIINNFEKYYLFQIKLKGIHTSKIYEYIEAFFLENNNAFNKFIKVVNTFNKKKNINCNHIEPHSILNFLEKYANKAYKDMRKFFMKYKNIKILSSEIIKSDQYNFVIKILENAQTFKLLEINEKLKFTDNEFQVSHVNLDNLSANDIFLLILKT